jgi:predicted metal-dependent phosphotriesterase family hydrolase
MRTYIQTVLGPVAPAALGITDGHNHVWITRQNVRADDAPILDQQEDILAELVAYRQAGGRAQIDCQPVYAGRDGNMLRWLSERSGVHIVANTGFHLPQYYPEGAPIWTMTTDQAADFFLAEIREGLIETRETDFPVLPGFIKIAVPKSLVSSPKHLIEAVVQVSLITGYLIEMHTEKGQDIEAITAFITELGLPPDRLVICHMDKRPDFNLHRSLAERGFLLEYDTFFRSKYGPEANLWPLIEEMVDAGLAEKVVLATDLADNSLWAFGGGPGISGFVRVIKQRLEEMTIEPSKIALMLGGNIGRQMAIDHKELMKL